MRKLLLLCLCFSTFVSTRAQLAVDQKTIKQGTYVITVAPSIFPLGRFGVQPGFQYKFNKHFAWVAEVGFPLVKNNDQTWERAQFLKMQTELKWYPGLHPYGRFLALQAGFTHRRFEDADSGSYRNFNGQRIGYSSLAIKSPVTFVDVKYGAEVVQMGHFFLDFFWGLGVRVINNDYQSAGEYTGGRWPEPADNWGLFVPTPSWQQDRRVVRPHVAIGFRVGRKF